MNRCYWCSNDPVYIYYHDHEWGVPVHDDRHLFEMLILEGAQAGLSWITILRKRDAYREAFCNFEVTTVAAFTEQDVNRLMQNEGIVRNRLKISAAIQNARCVLALLAEGKTLNEFLWCFVDHQPIVNQGLAHHEIPTQTDQSVAMSRALKKRGFKFVGPTICYAFMQAVGMVNDHEPSCFLYVGPSKL
ncbi:MAG: DNA-3-methyladenine glycosylase I [Oceanospirillales bacterium]|nr:MAG: DNA-3-methyladenine glycosylase I [Oceanospirillales bacterium]